MICFINRSSIDYDVRLQKYVQACKITNTSYFVISWDRLLNAKFIDEHEYQMKLYCPYAQGKKFIPLFRWFFFVWYYLIKNFRKYKVIHACNMENTLLSLPFKLLGKKVIFDVYDSQLINVERRISPKVDCLILPAEKRLEQIGLDKGNLKKFLEIENVPTFSKTLEQVKGLNRDKIYLSYVGVFQKHIRGLENLINMVLEDERFVLDIAGVGDGLESLILESASKCNRIHYYGKVQYDEALSIMNNSDFIVALYYPYFSNHIYASPNKSYESLFLATPIITSEGTLVGDKVVQSNTGYIVNDTLEGLRSLFDNFDSIDFKQGYISKCKNCESLWNKAYSNYLNTTLIEKYLGLVKSIAN